MSALVVNDWQLLRATMWPAIRIESLLFVDAHGRHHVQRLHGAVEEASNTKSVQPTQQTSKHISLPHRHATICQSVIHACSTHGRSFTLGLPLIAARSQSSARTPLQVPPKAAEAFTNTQHPSTFCHLASRNHRASAKMSEPIRNKKMDSISAP
jgi:hypothetical protein